MNKGIGIDYTGDNSRLLSEVKDFKVTSYADAIAKSVSYTHLTLPTNREV